MPAGVDHALVGAGSSAAVAPPSVRASAATPSPTARNVSLGIRNLHRSSSRAGRSRDSRARRRCLVSKTARTRPEQDGSAREFPHTRHTSVIELRFQLPDPRRRLAAVRLAHELRDRLPHELTRARPGLGARRAGAGRRPLRVPARADRREGARANGSSTRRTRRRASGPWGDKSVWEEPGYAPPGLGRREPVGEPETVDDPEPDPQGRAAGPDLGPSGRDRAEPDARRARRARVRGALRAPRPLLGRAAAAARRRCSAPVDRNEIVLGVGALRARARRRDPARRSPPAPRRRIGIGASLGALALLHAHRRHPESFGGLFLQSGSFFRRADAPRAGFPRFERIARFVGGVLATGPSATIPIVLACGTVEENLPATARSRRRCAARATTRALHENRDGAQLGRAGATRFHPHLLRLLQRI